MTILAKSRQLNLRIDNSLFDAMSQGLWEFGEQLSKHGKVTSVNMATLTRYAVMLMLGMLPRAEATAWLAKLAVKYSVVDDLIHELSL
jgi:hypothetical protein